jgi:hypothetical protein
LKIQKARDCNEKGNKILGLNWILSVSKNPANSIPRLNNLIPKIQQSTPSQFSANPSLIFYNQDKNPI